MLILAVHVIVFAHLVWLGLYLLRRSTVHPPARMVGFALGLMAVTVGIGASEAADSGREPIAILVIALVAISMGLLLTGLVRVGFSLLNHKSELATNLTGRDAALWIAMIVGATVLIFADAQLAWYVPVSFGLSYLPVGVFTAQRLSEDAGEAFLPDIARSYDYSFLISGVFGGQVVLAMWTGPGATQTMTLLLLGTIAAAVGIQVYLDRVQGLLDRIAFANVPWLRAERADLRQVENLLPRVNMTDPLTIDDDEFKRLTRRALSNFGDLTKLATSPLTNLPEIHRRLAIRNIEPTTLERARELKILLADAIDKLKPPTDEQYGTTDEWRYYNSLHYLYVVGMRPYSVTAINTFDGPEYEEVLDWFRIYVPERTLYNWQNSAAALIAGHLHEQEKIALSQPLTSTAELTTTS